MMMAGDSDDMEIDHRVIEIEHFALDDEPYLVAEDEHGDVVTEGFTVDSRR